jgi:TPR repeat protein
MDIRKLTFGLALSLLLGSGVLGAADYDKGYDAWWKGDYKAALAEWIPLAEKGNDKAQCKLGYMHDNGKGLLENHMVGLEWVIKSAIQGNGWCQNYLGLMYEKGRGVSRDITKAYMWFNLADYNDSIHASGNKIRLTKGESIFNMPFEAMTISDISKAQLMSSRCLESNYTDC